MNDWDGPIRFLEDGRIELDTNVVERGIRPIVLNRKNAFVRLPRRRRGERPCVASVIETCK